MDKQTQKAVIAKNLKNWYIIDSILFNANAREVIAEGAVFKEYVALKASLLSNLYEYYQHVNYAPVDSDTPSSVRTLQESAVTEAKKGKSLSADLLSIDKFKAKLKNHIVAESKKHNIKDLSKFQDKIVEERFKQFALDNCLIGLPLLESISPDAKCGFECQILENAHRMMRDNLVRLSLTCRKKSLVTEKFSRGFKIAAGLIAAAGIVLVGKRIKDVDKWRKLAKKDIREVYKQHGAPTAAKTIVMKYQDKIILMVGALEDSKIYDSDYNYKGKDHPDVKNVYIEIAKKEIQFLKQSAKELRSMVKYAKTQPDKDVFTKHATKQQKKADKIQSTVLNNRK
jgi:hypothetical protein